MYNKDTFTGISQNRRKNIYCQPLKVSLPVYETIFIPKKTQNKYDDLLNYAGSVTETIRLCKLLSEKKTMLKVLLIYTIYPEDMTKENILLKSRNSTDTFA